MNFDTHMLVFNGKFKQIGEIKKKKKIKYG
jgi:hypothetical protein